MSSLALHNHDDKPPKLLPRESKTSHTDAVPIILHRQKVERGRKNVSRACQACRQRRIRCTTDRPCRPCQATSVKCVDDGGPEGVDLRTIRLGPHCQQVYVQQKTLLDRLLRAIRAGAADEAIKCIKEGGTLGDISRSLDAVENISNDSQTGGVVMHKNPLEVDHAISNDDKKSQNSSKVVNVNADSLTNFGNLPMSSAIRTNGLPPSIQDQQLAHLSQPVWACSPLISDDASTNDPFSRACFSFRALARQQLAAGASIELVLSSHGIEMDLLFRDRTPADPHTVSTWACELMKAFDVLTPVIRLAAAEAVACLMRWLIAPTKEHYMALPESSRPIASQFFIPHTIAIDIMMYPELRHALLIRGDTQLWMNNITSSTMDIHWPYSIDACLEFSSRCRDDQTSCMRLSKAFIEHIRDVGNVTLDRVMLSVFPEFEGVFRWHDPKPHPVVATSSEIIDPVQS